MPVTKKIVAHSILMASATYSAFCLQTQAIAQQATTGEGATLEEIVVTGSRIRQNPLEVATPVQTLSDVDIKRTGDVAIGDFLQRLPISGSAINRTNNSSGNLGFPPDGGGIGAGATEIDLRYLGSKRVLVLVDGKRWVKGSSGSGVAGSVDLNTIPAGAISRVEILQDGASPIYGSDAIGGVVNIITKKDFEGFNATAYTGAYGQGDGWTQDYDLSWGAKTEKARLFFDVTYAKQNSVNSGDRAISSQPIFGAIPQAGGSSATPQGRFRFLDPRGDFDGDGEPDVLSLTLNNGINNTGAPGGLPRYDPNNPNSLDFHNFATADRFNFSPYNYLSTPNSRLNLFAKAEYDLTENIVFRVTGTYNNRKSTNQAAPEPLFLGSDSGSGFYLTNVFIPANHPYNPFGIDLDGQSNLILLGRRPIEAGPRIFKQNVNTWLVTGTLEGKLNFGSRSIFWDANITWGKNSASQRKFNGFNARKLALALGPVANCNATPGCVPFNIFGGQGANGQGSITRQMLDFVTYQQNDQSGQDLFDVTLNASGELFNLPAGPIGYAIGYEHRKESGFFQPDPVVAAGETADVPALPTDGSITANEFYAEIRVPLLANLPLVKKMELSGALRISDYDRFGSQTILSGGANWRVIEDLLLRFKYSEGIRAPNIGELFNQGSRFDSALNDPCSNFTTKSAAIQASCVALGVPGAYTQINPQISVQTGGNLNLRPETSKTWTAGFTYSPSWLSNNSFLNSTVMEFNYYRISLKGAIQALNAQDQLDRCIATLSATFCNGIVRGPGGSIIAFANQLTNIGAIKTSGIDWSVNMSTREFNIGQFQLQWQNTLLIKYNDFTPGTSGLITNRRAGTELGSPIRGFPKYKSSLTLGWSLNTFSASVTERYISGLTETCPGVLFDFGVENLCSNLAEGTNKLSNRFYTDVQITWSPEIFDREASFTIGVNNLFDKDPPVCYSCDIGGFDGTLYPVPGQFVYGRVSVKF